VIFRRILLLLALVASACTPDGAPPQTASAPAASGRDARTPALPRDIQQRIGAQIYAEPGLHAYVERVGRRLLAQGGVTGSGYSFYVLDTPTPNAHALPSGHIFVTRGLLALLDDEAELAAALAHELGHVARRHAAERERQRQTALDAAFAAARTTGSVAVGTSVAREGMLALRRYSREQELDADRVGVGYIRQAGYRSDAMLSLIEKLRRQARLEGIFHGQAPDAAERRSALSTHPASEDRLAALLGVSSSGGETGRDAFLQAIDGMVFDDSPQEGFVRGTAFLHPVMKLAFQAPPDFRLLNDHDGVIGVGRDRALMYFTCTRDQVKGSLVDWMRNEVKPTPSGIETTSIGGAEAAISERPRGAETGLANFRQVFIRRGDGVCFFNLLSDGMGKEQRMEAMIAAARSFRILGEAEAAALRPYRLRVLTGAGMNANQLASRLPYGDFRLERLLALNGVDTSADLANKRSIKTIEP
jgi:predicted Zn-dependent protease